MLDWDDKPLQPDRRLTLWGLPIALHHGVPNVEPIFLVAPESRPFGAWDRLGTDYGDGYTVAVDVDDAYERITELERKHTIP